MNGARASALREKSLLTLLCDVSAPALLLIAPFISFIAYNEYSYLTPEIWICLGGLAAVGVVIGLAGVIGGWPVRVALAALLLVLWVDLQFDWLNESNDWPRLRVIGTLLLALILCLALRTHLTRIVTAVFTTILASTVLLSLISGAEAVDIAPNAAADPGVAPRNSQLPTIVHFVLDEHIGIEGIPDNVPHGQEMRSFLGDFFQTHDFRTFTRAYSHYDHTYNSLPNLVNFTAAPADGAFTTSDSHSYVLRDNAYFDHLGRAGYRIHVYQTEYMDFCTASRKYVVDCQNRPITGIKIIETLNIPVRDKVTLIYRRFADLSKLVTVLVRRQKQIQNTVRLAGITLPQWWFKKARLGPLPVMPVFDDVTAEVARAQPGEMFFVYLLIPHFPYVYDAKCDLRPASEWEWSSDPEPLPANDPESRERRYGLYLEQMGCLYRKLDVMFQAWRKAGIFDRLTIVIHGDHGSRINELAPSPENQQKLSRADYLDAFSTLFAIKGPGVAPGPDRRVAVIQQLLEEAVGYRRGGDDSTEQRPFVYLVGERGDVVRQPFSAFDD